MSPSSKNLTFPRWLPPAEREDMWERVLREYREDLEHNPPKPPPRRAPTWQEMEEVSDRDLIEGMQEAIAELFFENTAPAVWARVFEPGRYPRLHLAGGKRAGRVGAARFKGRYHPHLLSTGTPPPSASIGVRCPPMLARYFSHQRPVRGVGNAGAVFLPVSAAWRGHCVRCGAAPGGLCLGAGDAKRGNTGLLPLRRLVRHERDGCGLIRT